MNIFSFSITKFKTLTYIKKMVVEGNGMSVCEELEMPGGASAASSSSLLASLGLLRCQGFSCLWLSQILSTWRARPLHLCMDGSF